MAEGIENGIRSDFETSPGATGFAERMLGEASEALSAYLCIPRHRDAHASKQACEQKERYLASMNHPDLGLKMSSRTTGAREDATGISPLAGQPLPLTRCCLDGYLSFSMSRYCVVLQHMSACQGGDDSDGLYIYARDETAASYLTVQT